LLVSFSASKLASPMATSTHPTEVVHEGIPASPGIAMGPVHVIARGFSAPEVFEIDPSEVAHEQERFRLAVELTKKQLAELQTRLENIAGKDHGDIFEAHIMMLEDPAVFDRVSAAIASRNQNAEYAFYAVMQTFLEGMRRIPDPYLRERTADIEDVSQRVLRNFQADSEPHTFGPDETHILVAYDLTPSDTPAWTAVTCWVSPPSKAASTRIPPSSPVPLVFLRWSG